MFSDCIKIVNKAAKANARQSQSKEPPSYLPILVLILDVITRWNSTYYMLKRAHKLRRVSTHLSDTLYYTDICAS